MGRQLSPEEIDRLTKYYHSTGQLPNKTSSYFSKDETIQILNAVTEFKTITEDGLWLITYRDNGRNFFVKPHRGFVPCGDFETQSAVDRLEL